MRARLALIAFFVGLFLSFSSSAHAVDVVVTDYPTEISNVPFSVSVTVSGAQAGQNFLRVDLFKDGTSNYFGETFNGSDWYKGSNGTQYAPVTIDSSKTGSLTFQGRIGNPTEGEFSGSGDYKLRIRRYTQAGNVASSDTQTPVDIFINFSFPTPTPTPSPTPKPTATPKPTKEPTPTKIPIPTKTPTVSQAIVLGSKSASTVSSKTITPTKPDSKNSDINKNLNSNSKEFTVSQKEKEEKVLEENTFSFATLFIGLGIVFILFCGILIFYPHIKKMREGKNE